MPQCIPDVGFDDTVRKRSSTEHEEQIGYSAMNVGCQCRMRNFKWNNHRSADFVLCRYRLVAEEPRPGLVC